MKAYNPDSTGNMIHGNIFTGPVESNGSLDGWFCRKDIETWIKERIADYKLTEEYLSAWHDGYRQALEDLCAALDTDD